MKYCCPFNLIGKILKCDFSFRALPPTVLCIKLKQNRWRTGPGMAGAAGQFYHPALLVIGENITPAVYEVVPAYTPQTASPGCAFQLVFCFACYSPTGTMPKYQRQWQMPGMDF